jgi:hypothetical protein
MLPGLLTPDGFDYSAIEIVLNAHRIRSAKREIMLRQIVGMVGVIDKERQKRRQK